MAYKGTARSICGHEAGVRGSLWQTPRSRARSGTGDHCKRLSKAGSAYAGLAMVVGLHTHSRPHQFPATRGHSARARRFVGGVPMRSAVRLVVREGLLSSGRATSWAIRARASQVCWRSACESPRNAPVRTFAPSTHPFSHFAYMY